MIHPFTREYIGNDRIRNRLEALAKSRMIGYAYLFSGPERLGKRTLAEKIASQLLDDPLRVVRLAPVRDALGKKKDGAIEVSVVREARRRLSVGAESSFSVCIIDDAHRMTDASKNALLKILEEPIGKTLFFLITHAPGKLLPTVRSRCENVRFDLVDESVLYEAVREDDEEKRHLLARLSFGRPGILSRLVQNKEEMTRREAIFRFFETFPNRSVFERLQLAKRITAKPASVLGVLEDWIEFERRRVRSGADTKVSYERIEKLLETRGLFEHTNANTRLLLEVLLISI